MTAITFAVTLVTLLVAHHVADHWVQTDGQATSKGRPGWAGRLADLRHVLTLTATLAAALLLVAWRVDITYNPGQFTAGLAVNAISHYLADRWTSDTPEDKWPLLRRLANAAGKAGWVKHDPGARYHLDQSWHWGWLLVTALILV